MAYDYNLSTWKTEAGGLEFKANMNSKVRPLYKTNMSKEQGCDLSGPAHTHSLALLTASGVPQLVEPVLWDYGADLDVHSKSQYRLITLHSSWCMCLHDCFPVLRDPVT